MPLPRQVEGEVQAPLARRPEGAHVRADRRHRRRTDHVVAGKDRRGAQLGLPLLLAPRRDAHAPRLPQRRLSRGGACLARLAVARGRRRSVALQIMYGVAGERRLSELDAPVAAGLRGLAAGTRRKRRRRTVSARRLRRGPRRVAPGAASTGSSCPRRRGRCSAGCSASSRTRGRSPTKASGRYAGRGGTSRTRR